MSAPQPYAGTPVSAVPNQGPTPALARPTSGLAVAGFILSLLWLFGLGSVAAIACSIVAFQRTKTGQAGGHGLAVASLVIGVLGLISAVLIVVSFLLFPLLAAGTTAP